MPTLCAEACVGRIRYMGVILYDADRILEMAGQDRDRDLYRSRLSLFLDPSRSEVVEQARADGVPDSWISAARNFPVCKMAIGWKIAFPIRPEFRTLPMVWYVPPLSPDQSQIDQGRLPAEVDGAIPKAEALRLPVRYLANLLTAGDEAPVVSALNCLIVMRSYQRSVHVDGKADGRARPAPG